jgi:hypothetical protein
LKFIFEIGFILKSNIMNDQLENQTNFNVVKTGDWFLTLLITAIPLVGFIMLFVWAFSGGTNPSKANWAKAALLWFAVLLAIYLLVILVFGAAFLSAFK